MPNRVFKLTPKADGDMENIWAYSASKWSAAQASDYTNQFLNAFADLANDLRSGTAISVRANYRRLFVGSHAIFYRETPDQIVIIRVLHQSMDIARHL